MQCWAADLRVWSEAGPKDTNVWRSERAEEVHVHPLS